MRRDRFETNFNYKDLHVAPEVKRYEDMVVSGFCMVGHTKIAAVCCFYAKGHMIDEQYPQGIFWEVGGDERFWDAKEVFEAGIRVWQLWPKKFELIGDDRPCVDEVPA